MNNISFDSKNPMKSYVKAADAFEKGRAPQNNHIFRKLHSADTSDYKVFAAFVAAIGGGAFLAGFLLLMKGHYSAHNLPRASFSVKIGRLYMTIGAVATSAVLLAVGAAYRFSSSYKHRKEIIDDKNGELFNKLLREGEQENLESENTKLSSKLEELKELQSRDLEKEIEDIEAEIDKNNERLANLLEADIHNIEAVIEKKDN